MCCNIYKAGFHGKAEAFYTQNIRIERVAEKEGVTKKMRYPAKMARIPFRFKKMLQ